MEALQDGAFFWCAVRIWHGILQERGAGALASTALLTGISLRIVLAS